MHVSDHIFVILLKTFAFAPLVLLASLFFVRTKTWRFIIASFILFLPALLLTVLWTTTKPSLGDFGGGLVIMSAIWILCTSAPSIALGFPCVRSNRWVLLWLVPESLLFLFLGLLVIQAYR
jgi:hypothetical protein